MTSTVILCPLKMEFIAARRVAGASPVMVRCIGPGPRAVQDAMPSLDQTGIKRAILFGLAGALGPAPSAAAASTVLDESGRSWSSGWRVSRLPALPLLGVDQPICSAADKRRLHESTGAALVDCESHAFAEAASLRGWRWMVVRGVSDNAQTDLPEQVAGWTDPRGRVRLHAVTSDVLRRPALIADLRRLRRSARNGLDAAGKLLAVALESIPDDQQEDSDRRTAPLQTERSTG